MNKAAMISEALLVGLKYVMEEEQRNIPSNSGFSMELMKVWK